MFGNKVFLFKEPMTKRESRFIQTDYERVVQVIVCGSGMKDVIQSINEPALPTDGNKEYYAFKHSTSGKLTIHGEVEVSSSINYKEKRKKDKKDIAFKHEDQSSKTLSSDRSISTAYTACEPIFNSPFDTYVIMATKDDDEEREVTQKLLKMLNGKEILKYIIIVKPHNVEGDKMGWSIREPLYFNSSSISYICEPIANMDKQFIAKSIADEMQKDADKYIQQLIANVGNNVKDAVVKEFEENLHQKADEYFEAQKSCCRLM